MRTFICLFCIALFLSNSGVGQNTNDFISPIIQTKYCSNQFSTRLGLNTINQFNLSYNFQFARNFSGIFEAQFHPGKEGHRNFLFCSNENIMISRQKKGLGFKIGASFLEDSDLLGAKFTFMLHFRTLKIDSLAIDEGCFSGSGSSHFEALDWSGNDLGIMIYFDRSIGKRRIAGYYAGLGIDKRFEKREIFLSGFFSSPTPVEYVETREQWIPRIDLGLRFNLWSF